MEHVTCSQCCSSLPFPFSPCDNSKERSSLYCHFFFKTVQTCGAPPTRLHHSFTQLCVWMNYKSWQPLWLSACSSQTTTALLSSVVVCWVFLSMRNCLHVRCVSTQLTLTVCVKEKVLLAAFLMCCHWNALYIKFKGNACKMHHTPVWTKGNYYKAVNLPSSCVNTVSAHWY